MLIAVCTYLMRGFALLFAFFNPHFPSIVDIQCGEKAILL